MSENKNITGIYQIHQPIVNWYAKIEDVKQALTLRFSIISVPTLQSQLSDLYSDMLMFLEKAFYKDPGQIKNKKVTINGREFNFYELKAISGGVNDRDTMRLIFENMSLIFEYFTGLLKITLPTESKSVKKKLPLDSFTPM